nr:hypothetical protein [Saprospiraceae bacterium]
MKLTFLLLNHQLNPDATQFLHTNTGLKVLPVMPSKEGDILTLFDNTSGFPIIVLKVNLSMTYKNTAYMRKVLLQYKGKITINFLNPSEVADGVLKNVVLGCKLWEYDFASLKTNGKISNKVTFDASLDKKIDKEVSAIATAMITTMKIIDLPPNLKNPDYLVDFIEKLTHKSTLKVEVKAKKELIEKGYGALVSVGQASDFGTYLAIISYKGNKKNKVDYALIGKGVTFDTGGISIKPSTNMHYMKSDLGGAAAVIGAMQLIAEQKPSTNITAVIPLVENVISAKATRPGDVITAYN